MRGDSDYFAFGGCDLYIKNDCNLLPKSGSNLGYTYELPF